MSRFIALLIALVIGAGCAKTLNEIPAQFQGEYSFDKTASIEYWDAQPEWPVEVKERLKKMAIPTMLRIESDRVVVADVASGDRVTRHVTILHVGSETMELDLHSNFAQTNKVTTLQFDAGGLWLCEGTLFPNYRERFERVRNP